MVQYKYMISFVVNYRIQKSLKIIGQVYLRIIFII